METEPPPPLAVKSMRHCCVHLASISVNRESTKCVQTLWDDSKALTHGAKP